MTCYEINLLASLLPEERKPGNRTKDDDASLREVLPFLHSYGDLSFGWDSARLLHESGNGRFPVVLPRKDLWVLRAWLYMERNNNSSYRADPIIKAAVELNTRTRYSETKAVLEASLLARDATISSVSDLLKIPEEVVEAYEVLFFNVIDRREDLLYLRNVVYPHARIEEMVEDYFNRKNVSKLLQRIGYNHGIKDLLWFSGFRDASREKISGNVAAGLFQEEVMVQGYMLARNGFLNFPRQTTAIHAARSIIQASKIGGDEMRSDDGTGLGSAIRDSIMTSMPVFGRLLDLEPASVE